MADQANLDRLIIEHLRQRLGWERDREQRKLIKQAIYRVTERGLAR